MKNPSQSQAQPAPLSPRSATRWAPKSMQPLGPSLPALVLAIYLGTAPVYWLPGISVPVVTFIKYALIIVVLSWSVADSFRDKSFFVSRGVFGALGISVIYLSMSAGFFQSEISEVLRFAFDLIICFSMVWLSQRYSKDTNSIVTILSIACLILSVFLVLTISSNYTANLNFRNPYAPLLSVSSTGYGGARTGWSLGTAMYTTVFLMVSAYISRTSRLLGVSIALTAVSILFWSHLTVGGRTGMVGTVVATIVWIVMLRNSIYSIIIGSIVGIVIMVALGNDLIVDFLSDALRLGSGRYNLGAYQLDTLSSGRLSQYDYALRLISERPLTGHGLNVVGEGSRLATSGIHNIWLKFFAQGGFVPVVVIGGFCLFMACKAVALSREWKTFEEAVLARMAAGIIISGLAMSMFEPSVIIGTFQTSAMWWVAVGVVSVLSARMTFSRRAIRAQRRARLSVRPIAEQPSHD